jgi:hypothetical protein
LVRGDVGLLPPRLGTYFCFFSAGFRIWRCTVRIRLFVPNASPTYLKGAKQALVDAHHCTSVVEFTAVVGRAEQRYELTLREELIAVLHNLMSATYEVHVVLLQEAGYNVWTKREADTSVVLTPTGDVLIRIRPQEIAKESTVGNLPMSAYVVRQLELSVESKLGRR